MLRDWIFSRLMLAASRYHEPMVAGRKRRLLEPLRGSVLEIGPGDGVNQRYLAQAKRWTGFEPNRFLAGKIAVPAGGELLVEPFAAHGTRYDAVVSTLVLCSVPDLAAALRDIRMSLKPGGRFVFLEHVGAAPGTELRRRQESWTPVWRCLAGGCHPNRDLESAMEEAGLRVVELERFQLPLALVSPHIAGVAERD
jgi:SAM-dependent methyltransferase